jgi:TRAP-type C4-dicarboxylate transport system permease small subunit
MESPFRNYLQRINTLLGKIETGLLCLIVAMMIGLAILEIVLRYGFKTSLLWKHIMLQNLTLWLCFLGAALASAERRHISIDVLSRILPKNILRYSSYIIDVLSLIVISILAYFGFGFLIEEQQSPATLIGSIPLWWAKTIIPIGFVLIGIHLALQIGIRLTERKHHQDDVRGESD